MTQAVSATMNVAAQESAAEQDAIRVRPAGHPLVELTKARLSSMVLVTTGVGYVLAATGPLDWARFVWTLLGTALAAFGANALNQCLEVEQDLRMVRTRNRPIPAGRMTRKQATILGIALALVGPTFLLTEVGLLPAGLALLTVVLYVGVYTPLKRVSSINTLVGAVCGALPPMIGWAAVTGRLDAGAWVLGFLLFIWQIPHFLALAWMYRDDYARGGFRMLPLGDTDGTRTFNVAVLYTMALLPLGPLAAIHGVTGWPAAFGSVVLGVGFLTLCLRLRRERTRPAARAVFLASLVYLPLVLALMVVDRGPAQGFGPIRFAGPVTVDHP